jgi:soluble cytochrome b562
MGMNFEKPSVALENINAALAEIESIRGEISQMGANDAEMSQIDLVVNKLNKGELKACEAVESVIQIRDSKNAYH